MKHLLLTGIFSLSLLSCQRQVNKHDSIKHEFGNFKFFQDKIIKTRLREIVRTDTIKEEIGYLIYKSYDVNDSLVRELSYYPKSRYFTCNMYNENGKIISYELFTVEGLKIEQYIYKYRADGLLAQKEGFGSGEIGITINYFYSSKGKLIDKKAFRSGNEVLNYFDN
ncbi:MAG: hypothetical protein PHR83_16165 [Paludibacter sp.]|nr:hypothetical protein [Paludibacter sp.]